jgi:hypothetical protein
MVRMRAVFLVCALGGLTAQAQNSSFLQDLVSARSLGMGGGSYGSGFSADSVLGNPAAMNAFRRYQIELGGGMDFASHFAYGSATIVDSQTSPVAVGLDYHLLNLGNSQGGSKAHWATLALAIPLSEALQLGISGHYFLTPGSPNLSEFTGDVGLMLKLSNFQLGASGHDLFGNHLELPRYFLFSGSFSAGPFSAALNVRADFDRAPKPGYVFGGGLEYLASNSTPVRVGYSNNSGSGEQYLSGGLGLTSDSGGIDLGYRHQLNGPGRYLVVTLHFQP